jgi:hypothetical protein
MPLWLWLRFTVLLFGFCLIALIEGMLLRFIRFFLVCSGCWDYALYPCQDCSEIVGAAKTVYN